MSIRIYLEDEIDKYPPSAVKEGDPVQLAIKRISTFWNSLVFLVSNPSIDVQADRLEVAVWAWV